MLTTSEAEKTKQLTTVLLQQKYYKTNVEQTFLTALEGMQNKFMQQNDSMQNKLMQQNDSMQEKYMQQTNALMAKVCSIVDYAQAEAHDARIAVREMAEMHREETKKNLDVIAAMATSSTGSSTSSVLNAIQIMATMHQPALSSQPGGSPPKQ